MKWIKELFWLLNGRCTTCGAELEPPYSVKKQYCINGHKN